jgi:hypothetical protein
MTTIIALKEDRDIVAEVKVGVVESHRARRTQVIVWGFNKDSVVRHQHWCSKVAGCSFDKSEPNQVSPPMISTGPVITSGAVSSAPPR